MVADVVKPRSRATAWTCLAVPLLLAFVGGSAAAHPEISPQLVNRYVSLIVQEDRLDLSCSLLYGALPALDRRRAMDGNGDGRIDEGELAAERGRWKAAALAQVSVVIDDAPASLDLLANVDLGGDINVGPSPVVVEVGGFAPLPRSAHRLRVDPGEEPPRLGETEVLVDVGPDWRLTGTALGDGPLGAPERRVQFQGARTATGRSRAVTFALAPVDGGAARSATRRRAPVGLVAAGAGLLAVLGGGLAWRARRRGQRRTRANSSDARM